MTIVLFISHSIICDITLPHVLFYCRNFIFHQMRGFQWVVTISSFTKCTFITITPLENQVSKILVDKFCNTFLKNEYSWLQSKDAKMRNRYKQVPHLIQDTNGKVTNSQLDTTNKSQMNSHFPAGDHKAHINRRAQRPSKHKTEKKHKKSTKGYSLGTVSKIFYWMA